MSLLTFLHVINAVVLIFLKKLIELKCKQYLICGNLLSLAQRSVAQRSKVIMQILSHMLHASTVIC